MLKIIFTRNTSGDYSKSLLRRFRRKPSSYDCIIVCTSIVLQAPEGDQHLQDYYNSLQYTLYETGHPETVDRTFKPRNKPNNEQVNVVLLSSPVECIGILLEGNAINDIDLNMLFS